MQMEQMFQRVKAKEKKKNGLYSRINVYNIILWEKQKLNVKWSLHIKNSDVKNILFILQFLLERLWHWLSSGYSKAYLEINVWFYRIWAIMLPFSLVFFTSGTWTVTSNVSGVNLLYLCCLLSFVVCHYLKFDVSLNWNIKLFMNWKSWKSFRGRLLFMIL